VGREPFEGRRPDEAERACDENGL
ncbi:MAG: hypothetical protein QOK18_4420, partial [Mycobacterium sp.]|nr:hypothetical protein [Mycobacterium sp.]